MLTQSLTPASSTDWLPTGMPARVSLSTARATSGVISFGVVEVEVHPDRVVLGEHLAQLVVDALRQEDRHARADADDLDVGDLAQPAQDRLEELGRQRQAVAAADEHVAHLRRPAQVVELRLVLGAVEVLGRVAHDARPRAVAAVGRALRGDEHQHPVGVAVDQARHRRVAVLGERVLHHRREGLLLAAERDDLAADRVVRVRRVDERDEVRRDVDAELVRRAEALALLVGQLQDLLDLGQLVDAVGELPAPVVPLLIGNVRPERCAAAHRRHAVRPERSRRVAAVDERFLGGVLVRLGAGWNGSAGGLDHGPRSSALMHRKYARWIAAG